MKKKDLYPKKLGEIINRKGAFGDWQVKDEKDWKVKADFKSDFRESEIIINGEKARGILIYEHDDGRWGVLKASDTEAELGTFIATVLSRDGDDWLIERCKDYIIQEKGAESLFPKSVKSHVGKSAKDVLNKMNHGDDSEKKESEDTKEACKTDAEQSAEEIQQMLDEMDDMDESKMTRN